MLSDLKFALRGLRRQPGFAVLAILTLALGIGASTTMFSVIYNVLFDPFPYNAERVVSPQIRRAERAQDTGRYMYQTAEHLDLMEQSTVFEEVIAGAYEDLLYQTKDGTEGLTGALVSGNTFSFLGVPAALGRTLTPDDCRPNAPPVCVLSYRMWRKYFNEDPDVIGRSIVVNSVPTTVVGVMPLRFTKQNAAVYRPIVLDRADAVGAERFYMFQARLKQGVTLEQAEAEMTVIFQRLQKVYPRNYPEKYVVRVVNWVDNIVGRFRQTLYTLSAAVGLLLLIACGNVANMLLARASGRSREMALRAALGADRGRLIRQLLVESLLLAGGGALFGWLFAWGGIKLLVAYIPDGAIPKEAAIELNVPVLAFSLLLAVVTAVVFGLVPALQTARRDLVEPLKDASKGAGMGSRGGRLRASLVVAEVALSLVLLTGAGLLMRSFVKMQMQDLGFDPERIMGARLPFPRGQYRSAAEKQRYFEQLLPRLAALPGVEAATLSCSVPPYGGYGTEIEIVGQPPPQEQERVLMDLASVDFFKTVGMRLQRGRLFTETEIAEGRSVAVINATFAAKYFPNEDPIGRQIVAKRLANMDGRTAAPTFEIIGVTTDIRNDGVERTTRPSFEVPYTITGGFERCVLLRAHGRADALVNSVRHEIWAVDPNVAVTDVGTAAGFLQNYAYASSRFSLLVLGVFAGLGLVLVTLGVYSVLAYAVARQRRDIGIRLALGATARDVLGMILGNGFRLLAIGAAIGLVVSIGVGRVLANQLRDVKPHDPLTLIAVVALVGLTGLIACWIPARRATKVDPMVVLREE